MEGTRLAFRGTMAAGIAIVLSIVGAAGAATLNIDNDIVTYGSLSNTTVTMTGVSELHLTSATSPLVNCQVNLNSADSWLFFENVRPADVNSTYLSQVRVSGSAAVSGTNVRVVEYVMGTVVIPHTPNYRGLTVYSGVDFTGSSMQMGLYTYYRPSELGTMNDAIRSFRLKRGYMATVAEESDGTGISRVYVAKDADVLIGSLPATLDRRISFVRVFPWRWVHKKGWAGGGTSDAEMLKCAWWYDWNNVATSTLNMEYVPMRHNRWWNSYANINNKQNSTHVLAFNEPDSSGQADMTVAQVLEQWPELLASGLRLGSPATTDGGLGWLYDFIDQADALDYRVDFVAVHYYKGCWSASQAYNWLQDIHEETGRPLWVTEWNNGANWTGCEPTFAEQATIINSYLDTFNNAPFIERYSIYNWVGDTRAMILNGQLTQAGIVYRDKVTPVANAEDLNQEYLGHWRLDEVSGTTANDVSGRGADATLQNGLSFDSDSVLGADGRALAFDGLDDYVQVPAGFSELDNGFSVSLWARPTAVKNWARFIDFGGGPNSNNLYLARHGTSNDLIFAVNTGATWNYLVASGVIELDQWQCFAATVDRFGWAVIYKNGQPVESGQVASPPKVVRTQNYLGRSNWTNDEYYEGWMDDVRLCDYAMRPVEVSRLYLAADPKEQWAWGGTPWGIPGRIEAEDYDEGGEGYAYHDTSVGNSGGEYRNDDVDILAGEGVGYAVWTAGGEWLEYTLDVTAGRYNVDVRVACASDGRTVRLLLDGVELGVADVPNTGSTSVYETVRRSNVELGEATAAVLRMEVPVGSCMVEWVEFTRIDQWPYGEVAWAMPGRVEAEDYDGGGEGYAYHDTSVGNSGGAYRDEDVDMLTTTDEGEAGYGVWAAVGEWLEYTVDVSGGEYTVQLRVSNMVGGQTVRVLFDGEEVGTVVVPATGGMHTYQTMVLEGVSLPPGSQRVLRVEFAGGGVMLNWVGLSPVDGCAYAKSQPGWTPLSGDVNEDCVVDAADLAGMVGAWLAPYDLGDFAALAGTWLESNSLP